jgi:WD40-like Beta Propeller Repeat
MRRLRAIAGVPSPSRLRRAPARRRTAGPLRVLALALLALLAVAAPARADVFGPISLASQSTMSGDGSPPQQADYAHDPAISGNGRYVAFDGSFGGVRGVWRRDLVSGEVLPVAVGQAADAAIAAGDAELPSISFDGRYVSFTTTAPLDPVDDRNSSPDVYVRDMDVPVYGAEGAHPCGSAASCDTPAAPGAFTLASAQNGFASGLAYAEPSSPLYGALAAGRSALSADGRKVVFVTTAVSSLDGEEAPATPALQVGVRDLDTKTTTLVSVRYDPATGLPAVSGSGQEEPVSGSEGGTTFGAVFAGAPPPRFLAPTQYGLTPTVGASISADGSTVAWMGQDVGAQVRTLPGEELRPHYAEPLWRRIAGGPQALTRRVSGGADPTSAACIGSGESALAQPPTPSDPCEGPFETEPLSGIEGDPLVDTMPMLSANGQTVAFLATAPPFGEGSFGLSVSSRPSDVYVSDMSGEEPRARALRPLSEIAGADAENPATDAAIVDLALSPDGEEVAFCTQRTLFPLGTPAYVSAPAASVGLVELFEADLADETLTRVTRAFGGGEPEHPHKPVAAGVVPYTQFDGSLSPSFSGDGLTLAFSSTASNLVYGDGNTPSVESIGFDGSDAFVVSRETFGFEPPAQEVSAAPPDPRLAPGWRLYLTARSRRDGTVALEASTPAAGTLRAGAIARRMAAIARREGRIRRTHRVRRRAGAAHGSARPRALAQTEAHTDASGVVTLVLKIVPAYRALAARQGGLSATVSVTFSSPGRPTLRATVPVTFLAAAAHRSGRAPRARRARASRPRRGGRR